MNSLRNVMMYLAAFAVCLAPVFADQIINFIRGVLGL